MSVSFPYWGEFFSIATAITWAFGVILFKKSGETMHPVALNIFKNVLAFTLILVTMLLLGEPLLVDTPYSTYLLLLASGILGIAVSDTLFFKSLNLVGAGLSAIIDCLYSPFIIGLSILFIGEHLTVKQILGVVLIIAAVLTVANKTARAHVTRRDMVVGYIYGAMAMLTMAVAIVMIKPVLCDLPILWVTEVRLLGGAVALGIYLFFHRSRSTIVASMSMGKGRYYALAGSVMGSYIALTLWMAGMKLTQACVAAALNQTSTVFVFIFSAILLKEPMNRQRVLAAIMGGSGSLLVVMA